MAEKITVKGSAGNDTIYGNIDSNYGVLYQYTSGDGYDIIYRYNSTDTISLGSGLSYNTLTNGSNVILNFSNGAITLLGASGQTLNIKGGNINSFITNYTKNTTVNGSSNADTVNNYAGGVKIYTGSGNDSIYNSTSSSYTINNSYGYVTIDAGDGNDTIQSYDPYVSISGGAGNDSIYSNFSNVTINGGTGNDTVYSDR